MEKGCGWGWKWGGCYKVRKKMLHLIFHLKPAHHSPSPPPTPLSLCPFHSFSLSVCFIHVSSSHCSPFLFVTCHLVASIFFIYYFCTCDSFPFPSFFLLPSLSPFIAFFCLFCCIKRTLIIPTQHSSLPPLFSFPLSSTPVPGCRSFSFP